MRKITSYIVALFSAVVLFSSCKKEYETVEDLDNKSIKAYKEAHSNLTFNDVNGYSYVITDAGAGTDVKNSDSVYYSYTFKSISGNIYNQTSDLMTPGTFLGYTDRFFIGNMAYVFKPVREVFSKLKRGGKATLLLPSRMAFGKNGLSAFGIGSNETIMVELGLYTYEKKHEVDAYEMSTFITRNNLTFDTDPSGIRYKIATAGTGTDIIGTHSTLVVNYTGRYLDGTVFDSGTNVTFRLDQLIKGWQVMLPGKITAEGKIRIIVPSHLGYGARPLDFDIEVTKVTND
ncbi:FKBP-type peptidyl-prolyl cis-trans isomerase [Pedobacter sp. UBA4863]|uniref:FKBP-type peptidyl-prolyl cis-trans isomerase n=1 Tax=Pedobacter sp. UBA4863 TaxID=1947060 RepID=UPI0025F11761|nr:FKBP-type peptidyl-prolyl cis-trans isomerase [Pedobacter sp. UBA4863]